MMLEKKFFVHYYEIDYTGRLGILSILKYLEDISVRHCEELGVGLDYLYSRNTAWFAYKWDLEVYDYPKFNEELTVVTNPYSLYKFYGYRKYEVYNNQNKLIMKADSLWLFVNIESKKPILITEEISGKFNSEVKAYPFFDIKELKEYEIDSKFKVLHEDIDTNKHVNNISYVKWAMESIDIEYKNNNILTNLKVIYKREGNLASDINVKTIIKNDITSIVESAIYDGDVLLCLIQSNWKPK